MKIENYFRLQVCLDKADGYKPDSMEAGQNLGNEIYSVISNYILRALYKKDAHVAPDVCLTYRDIPVSAYGVEQTPITVQGR